MTLIAAQSQVPTFQRKSGRRIVIERRRFPIHLIVAHLAIGWKLCSRMCRVRRGIVVFQVTSHASSGSPYISLRMALVASQVQMPSAQWKTGCRIVIEGTALPRHFRMTSLTIGAESCCNMRRVCGGVIVLLMAGNTGRRRSDISLGVA